MSFYKKLIAIMFSSFLVSITHAKITSIFPRGCEVSGFGYSDNFLILNETGEQTFYLIQNHSDKQIELEHYETDPDVFMSPKLQSKLGPGRWAAFASDVENMYFNCFIYKKEERVAVKCDELLDVCQYPRVKFALSNMGNYWVSTNKPQNQVIRDSIKKGIFLRW